MQDEDIDKIIRDAASQHHPPYDDTAWDKMEELLNKELPQKKDRRRPVLFLLLSLLIAGGAFFTFVYPKWKGNGHAENNSKNIFTEKSVGNDKKILKQGDPQADNTIAAQAEIKENVVKKHVSTILSNKNVNASLVQAYNAQEDTYTQINGKTKLNQKGKTHVTTKAGVATNDDFASNDNVSTPSENEKFFTQQTDINKTKTFADEPKQGFIKQEIITVKEGNKKETTTIPENKVVSKKEDKKDKKMPGNFGITFSAGTDLSFINVGNLGKATFMYGAGLSYDISKHIKVRTGFYVSKKIYDAKPSEYNAVQYPNLTNVAGDCKVYEIPVSVNYKFGAAKKHSWFAGAGLSSFIMKKEDYTYNYKTASGNTYNFNSEYNNQNKHIFSVLDLSGGYQYDVSKRISIMAEPYVKIPLTGIGQGKVKLNSTGIMLTATIKPFNKKKK